MSRNSRWVNFPVGAIKKAPDHGLYTKMDDMIASPNVLVTYPMVGCSVGNKPCHFPRWYMGQTKKSQYTSNKIVFDAPLTLVFSVSLGLISYLKWS